MVNKNICYLLSYSKTLSKWFVNVYLCKQTLQSHFRILFLSLFFFQHPFFLLDMMMQKYLISFTASLCLLCIMLPLKVSIDDKNRLFVLEFHSRMWLFSSFFLLVPYMFICFIFWHFIWAFTIKLLHPNSRRFLSLTRMTENKLQ